MNAKSIEEALLQMLLKKRQYSDSDLKLITTKVFETSTYIIQLSDMLERAVQLKKLKGDKDE
jgi:hypothetical protein